MEAARAEAERIKRIGEAEAYAVEAVGKAEAESMKLKAVAFKQYGDAAITVMVLESLPQVRILVFLSREKKNLHSCFHENVFCKDNKSFDENLLLQIAAEVAAPLAKTKKIVMVGGGDTVSNAINKMCSELPPAVHALTGVDLTKVSRGLGCLLLGVCVSY